MGKKVGLLGGSFDPVHFGHLNLALELLEKKGLDEVWFIPAQVNPHKLETPPTSYEHRLEMLNLALKEIPQLCVKDLERHLPSPSYTVNTLRHLVKNNPEQNEFYFLMGEDAIVGFFNWVQPEEIVRLVPLLIGSRSGFEGKMEQGPVSEAIQKGLISTRLMDISSTDVRHRLSQGLYCGHLIPASVLEYIKHHELYQVN